MKRLRTLTPAERLERIVLHAEAEFREVGIFEAPVAQIMRLAVRYDRSLPIPYVAKQVFRRLTPLPIHLEDERGDEPDP